MFPSFIRTGDRYLWKTILFRWTQFLLFVKFFHDISVSKIPSRHFGGRYLRDEFGLGCDSFCFRFNSPVGRRYFPKKGFVREGFRHRVLSFDLVSESTVIEQLGMVRHFLFHGNPYFLTCTSDSAIQEATAFQDIVRATGGTTTTYIWYLGT